MAIGGWNCMLYAGENQNLDLTKRLALELMGRTNRK